MKKIILILIVTLISVFAQAQTTTVSYKDSVYSSQVTVRIPTYTVTNTTTITIHDTIFVDKNCPCDTSTGNGNGNGGQTDTIYRGLYINSFDKILNSTSLQDALIIDLKRWKINSIHLYGLSNIGVSSYNKEGELIKRIRRETFVTEVSATAGSSSTFLGQRTSYNQSQSDSSDYDSWNLEFESWNASNVSSDWAKNLSYLQSMQGGKQAGQVENSIQYYGWWTKSPMTVETPNAIILYCDYLLLHDYRTAPDWGYMRSRMNDLNAAAKAKGKIFIVRVIFSAEPSFMQAYYQTHTLDEAYMALYSGFATEHYSNLKMDGYVVFHLDFLRVSQPTPSPNAAMMRMVAPSKLSKPEFSSPDFVNETTKDHLKTAEEPK